VPALGGAGASGHGDHVRPERARRRGLRRLPQRLASARNRAGHRNHSGLDLAGRKQGHRSPYRELRFVHADGDPGRAAGGPTRRGNRHLAPVLLRLGRRLGVPAAPPALHSRDPGHLARVHRHRGCDEEERRRAPAGALGALHVSGGPAGRDRGGGLPGAAGGPRGACGTHRRDSQRRGPRRLRPHHGRGRRARRVRPGRRIRVRLCGHHRDGLRARGGAARRTSAARCARARRGIPAGGRRRRARRPGAPRPVRGALERGLHRAPGQGAHSRRAGRQRCLPGAPEPQGAVPNGASLEDLRSLCHGPAHRAGGGGLCRRPGGRRRGGHLHRAGERARAGGGGDPAGWRPGAGRGDGPLRLRAHRLAIRLR